jgi:hypothetical protein
MYRTPQWKISKYMSYIGNQPTNTAFLIDTFSGDSVTTSFNLSVAPATANSILVTIGGILQDTSAYGVVGKILSFSGVPPTGTNNISVRFLGLPASNITTPAYRTVTDLTATAGQTTFSTAGYTPGFIDVYRNGVKLSAADFTATNGAQVVLVNPAIAGDTIQTVSFFVSTVANAIPGVTGIIGTSYIANSAVTPNKTDVSGTGAGALQLPVGDNSSRPATLAAGLLRYNTAAASPEYYTGTAWATLAAKDGTTSAKAALKSTDILLYNPSAPTGWYWLQINGIPTQVYVDNVFQGGGWVLCGTHPINVSIGSPTYAATTTGLTQIGSSGFTVGSVNPKAYATIMPLRQWLYIVTANGAGNNFIQMAAGSQVELGDTGSHSRRSSWKWTGWGPLYAWQGISGLSNDVGGSTPGLYTYATSGYNWTTTDADNDPYGPTNCSTQYGGGPWWYDSCWDGNFWGANGAGPQANAIHWTGSGADNYSYGAWYIK